MAETERFLMAGVMGWPVMHSRSPLMHNYWFAQQQLAGTYLPLAIEPRRIGDALRALFPLGFSGCNVTIPHKQAALAIVDEVDDVARRIGAISCVVVGEGGSLFGTNNDWIGFIGNLVDSHPGWTAGSGPAAVLGGGGGARAVCYGLIDRGVTEIRLINRTRERALRLADEIPGPITVVDWASRDDALAGVATAVNTTSAGMSGQPPLELRLDALPTDALAADIIYTPLETEFLRAARERGNPTVNGLGMLLHQGPPAWKRWFGVEPRVTPELRALMERSIRGG